MDTTYVLQWAQALFVTLAVEIPLYIGVSQVQIDPDFELPPVQRASAVGALCTLVTHPLLWFVWVDVVTDWTWYLITGEALVVLIEVLLFKLLARVSWKKAALASVIANTGSYLAGLLLVSWGIL